MELESYNKESAIYDRLQLRLNALYNQTHETIFGRRVRLIKRRRKTKANQLIDQALSDPIDVRSDSISQVKLMENSNE